MENKTTSIEEFIEANKEELLVRKYYLKKQRKARHIISILDVKSGKIHLFTLRQFEKERKINKEVSERIREINREDNLAMFIFDDSEVKAENKLTLIEVKFKK